MPGKSTGHAGGAVFTFKLHFQDMFRDFFAFDALNKTNRLSVQRPNIINQLQHTLVIGTSLSIFLPDLQHLSPTQRCLCFISIRVYARKLYNQVSPCQLLRCLQRCRQPHQRTLNYVGIACKANVMITAFKMYLLAE